MKHLVAVALILLLAGFVGIVAAQIDGLQISQQQYPHEGQPSHCSNAKTAPKAHQCECKKSEDDCDTEDKNCKVYCRKNHCHCVHPACDS